MDSLLKVLILEDLNSDAELIIRTLKKELSREFEYRHVNTRPNFIETLKDFNPDIILSDYGLPSFTGLEALEISIRNNPDTPLIIVTGSINEETAVSCMKAGASDYVLKDNLIRLVPAINGSLEKSNLIFSQRDTKKALNQNEKELNTIFNSSPAIMMVIDQERKVLKINKTGQDFSGKPLKEIFGKTVGKSLNCKYCLGDINCGDLEDCDFCLLKIFITNNFNKKENVQSEEINVEIEKDGIQSTHTFLSYFEQLTEKPTITYLITLIDISEGKRSVQKLIDSEKKFRELADALPEIVFEVDSFGSFMFLNKIAYQKFGVDPNLVETSKLNIQQFIHPDDREMLAKNISFIFQGENITGNDYRYIRAEGAIGYFQVFNTPVINNNRISGIRGIAVDVTERKRMEDELLNHREQLEELVRERTSELEKQTNYLKESQQALSFLLDDVNESREELLASNREIKKYTEELELFNKIMVDRELKIIEMKEEVNSLCNKLGIAIKYPPIWNNTSESN